MSKKTKRPDRNSSVPASPRPEKVSLPGNVLEWLKWAALFMKRPYALPPFVLTVFFLFLARKFPAGDETIGLFDGFIFTIGGFAFTWLAVVLFILGELLGIVVALEFYKRKARRALAALSFILSLIASTFFFVVAEHSLVSLLVPRDSRQILFYTMDDVPVNETVVIQFLSIVHRDANTLSSLPGLLSNDRNNTPKLLVHGMTQEDVDRVLFALDHLKRAKFIMEEPEQTRPIAEGDRFHDYVRIKNYRVTQRGKHFFRCYLRAQAFGLPDRLLSSETIAPLEGSDRSSSFLSKIPFTVSPITP